MTEPTEDKKAAPKPRAARKPKYPPLPAGINYALKPAVEYGTSDPPLKSKDRPKDKNVLVRDQARFNLVYLLYREQIEAEGVACLSDEIVAGSRMVLFDWANLDAHETRRVALGPPRPFLAYVDEDRHEIYRKLLKLTGDENFFKTMSANAEEVHRRLFVQGNVISLTGWRPAG